MNPSPHLGFEGSLLRDRESILESRLDEAGKARWRTALVAGLAGELLEIGAGTGMMFPRYPPGVRLTAVEPDEGFLSLAVKRAKQAPVPVEVQAGVGGATLSKGTEAEHASGPQGRAAPGPPGRAVEWRPRSGARPSPVRICELQARSSSRPASDRRHGDPGGAVAV